MYIEHPQHQTYLQASRVPPSTEVLYFPKWLPAWNSGRTSSSRLLCAYSNV